MDEDGNTTNPTKSPCDPYVFNTVLTRSKSLVVVVGNPVALLNIESHMKVLYGKKAQCWSSFIRLCLEKGSFHVPPEVEPNQLKRHAFKLKLRKANSDSNVQALPSGTSAVNPSPAKRIADVSSYPASSLAKSTTSKPPQKSAAAAPGMITTYIIMHQQ